MKKSLVFGIIALLAVLVVLGGCVKTTGKAYTTVNDSLIISGNIGIGTASPGRPLDIKISGDWGMRVGTGGANQIKISDSAIGQSPNDGGTYSYLFTAGDSFFNGGNVGIGTTSPGYGSGYGYAQKLDVRGDILAKSKLYLANSNFAAGDDDIFVLDGSTTGKLKFSYVWAGGPTTYDRMTIDVNGNVGIGTTSPAEKLEVAGNIKGTGLLIRGLASPQVEIDSTARTQPASIKFTTGSETATIEGENGNIVISGTQGGNIKLSGKLQMKSSNGRSWCCGPITTGTWSCTASLTGTC